MTAPDPLLCCMGWVMSPPIEVTVGGIRWWVAPECRDHLLGPKGLRLDEWLRNGEAAVVKQGPHRVVYRLELPKLRCHLKHNRISDLRSWLRALVRPSKARTEYRRALKVAARGVPTIVPLALGERADGRAGESFLLTRTLDEAMMFHTFVETQLPGLPGGRQARLRQRLAARLGEFIARVHEAGIKHGDLHCGNILVQISKDELPWFYLVDLQAVRLGRPLSWRASRENLVVLNRWPSLCASRTDRLRFWRAYCRARSALSGTPPPPETLSEWARQLEHETNSSNLLFWRRRDRRCLGANRSYRRIRGECVAGHAVTDLEPQALASLLANPDAPFRQAEQPLLKDSPSSTVTEVQLPVAGRLRAVIYKRFRITNWTEPLVRSLRRTQALRSWLLGHGLRERGLPTARPLAVFHRHRRGLCQEGYLLMEKVADAADLRTVVARLDDDPAARRQILWPLIDQLARVVRELHRRRLAHRDLKASNILVQLPASGPPACWLIDLVGVAHPRRLPRWLRARNLARLHASFFQSPLVSRTDKLRFLRTYLQWGLRGQQGWKGWWRAIAQATLAKVARNARSGRPLG
jgi:tRNA A-37 threonylcarbamoyl transferase component Bud32